MVCDMSPAFLTAIGKSFPGANVIVGWFHVVQLFATAMDEVRKAEAKERNLPKTTRWAVLKAAHGGKLTEKQQQALTELETGGFATATAWRLKERCCAGLERPPLVRTAQWRTTHFIPPCPAVHSARHQNSGPGPQGAHDSGRACSPGT
ncbi:hypothetical protein DFAR_3340010 [Desulfarculales bacterium]